MKAVRRSPAPRATAWLLTMAMVLPFLSLCLTPAHAQTQQALKVIVTDFVNKTNGLIDDPIARNATAAVYNELATSAQGRFDVIPNAEVLTEAKALGLRVPSNPNTPAGFSLPDLQRIAKQLPADAIVQGDVAVTPPARGRAASSILSVTVIDASSGDTINGGIGQASVSPRPGQTGDAEDLITKAIENAAMQSVGKVVQRQIALATVMNINGDTVILNRGVRDGIHEGDELVILREGPNGARIKEGLVRVARSYATDSEAEVVQNIGGIRPEDEARVLYKPAVVIATGGSVRPSETRTRVNFSAIGATLSAIGLGVLLSTANKGGQSSVTNVTSEPTADGTSAQVKITWGDNVFGQSGVQEYHIWRLPDFPFNSNVTLGNGNGNGGGGGSGLPGSGGGSGGGNGNTGTIAFDRLPIGIVDATRHVFYDRPSPFAFYINGATIKVGTGNGGLGNFGSGNSGNGNGNNSVNCGFISIGAGTDPIPTGFQPGTTYQYQVSAIIVRQTQFGAGNGNTGGNGSNGSFVCIESDPVTSSNATPVTPPLLQTPASQAQSVNIKQFSPTWTSVAGADVFQLEISTDRTFMNPNLIARVGPIFSTAPNNTGQTQTLTAPIDLTTLAPLLADPTFTNFVNGVAGAQPPQIFWRVGARHDADNPGPVSWINPSSGNSDRTFRWVYPPSQFFQPAPVPPPVPGKAANILNRTYGPGSKAMERLGQPGDVAGVRAVKKNHVPTIQDILTGRGRLRH